MCSAPNLTCIGYIVIFVKKGLDLFTYRCVPVLSTALDGVVERKKGVEMKATMLVE